MVPRQVRDQKLLGKWPLNNNDLQLSFFAIKPVVRRSKSFGVNVPIKQDSRLEDNILEDRNYPMKTVQLQELFTFPFHFVCRKRETETRVNG